MEDRLCRDGEGRAVNYRFSFCVTWGLCRVGKLGSCWGARKGEGMKEVETKEKDLVLLTSLSFVRNID